MSSSEEKPSSTQGSDGEAKEEKPQEGGMGHLLVSIRVMLWQVVFGSNIEAKNQ